MLISKSCLQTEYGMALEGRHFYHFVNYSCYCKLFLDQMDPDTCWRHQLNGLV